MNNSVQIRTIQPTDENAVMELHRNHYWREYCLLLNREFYNWQFILPPGNAKAGGDQSVVAFDDKGQLLSYLGVVLADASFQGRPIRAAHLITWLTAPEAQGRGVGKAIMSYMVERFDFLFGRSVTPAALSIYQRLGFRYFKNCSRWIAVLDSEATLSLAVAPSNSSIERAQSRVVNVDDSIQLCVDEKTPPGAARLADVVLSNSATFDRTHDYFVWRYEKDPFLQYKFLWLGEPTSPDGVAVVRVEDVSGKKGRVLRIVEFIASAHYSRKLAGAIFRYAREQQCAYTDMFGMSERFIAGFIAAGGFDAVEEPELKLPHLLQPWSSDVDTPGLLFFGQRNIFQKDGISPADDIAQIYVSKGDGNMDWCSWIPNEEGMSIAPPTRFAEQLA